MAPVQRSRTPTLAPRTAAPVRIRTLRTGGLAEADAAALAAVLDEEERARAARFAFERHRVAYIAAHALARGALGEAARAPAAAFRFRPGRSGKPAALLAGREADVSFNLSHTEGLVRVAVMAEPGADLGFDLEACSRPPAPEVEKTVFRPEERAWLAALPERERATGFLRLWTLKEAFVKATGQGLGADLMGFGFEMGEAPRIRFAQGVADLPGDWRFEQRLLGGGFVGAVGLRREAGSAAVFAWEEVEAPALLRELRPG